MAARYHTLTSEQIEAGRHMRERHGTSWYAIAHSLGCHSETIRRALDPGFAEYRRISQAKQVKARRENLTLGGVRRRCSTFKPKRSFKKPELGAKDYEPPSNEKSARRAATRQDDAFIDAMTKAVRAERETCLIGIDKRPGTHEAKFVASRGSDLMSATGSSAQMCADFA